MKKIFVLLLLLQAATTSFAQVYNPLSYSSNVTPVKGIKIITNLPFQSSAEMPTLLFEGYCYGNQQVIGFALSFYIYNGNFYNTAMSSFGSYAPPVYLANEGGKVVIFIDRRDYFTRFNVRAYAKGLIQDTSINYQGWTATDDSLAVTATQKTALAYKNAFAGDVAFAGGVWTSAGNVGIGTNSPRGRLSVNGDLYTTKLRITQNGWADFVFDSTYRLAPLSEVESYIQQNHHLPEIPTSREVEADGQDVGETNKRLLQKVEELTLYLIDMHKKLEAQEEKIKALESKH